MMAAPETYRADTMSAAQFMEELRRVGRLVVRPALEDPLASAVQQIELNPAFSQCRLLARILAAIACDRGEFRRAEASALDSATLALVIALMNIGVAGTLSRARWMAAIEAADLAQLRTC